ncbi:MAG: glycosyltransferase family 4 protein [Zoogloeaceae bacterium]|nr:glycosyltransferase family 4 protein [Zoogloeaceae bacterium]
MRILIVNRALGTLFGGGESFDLTAARYLEKRGHAVTLITGKPLFSPPNLRYGDMRVLYVRAPALRGCAYHLERTSAKLSAFFCHLDLYLFEMAVFAWLRKNPQERFDIVQMCSLFCLPQKILSKFNIPCVSWLPGPPSGLTRRQIRKLARREGFSLFAHGAPEDSLRDMGLRKGHEYEIIEPGVELEAIDHAEDVDAAAGKARLGLAATDLLGVTIARLVPVKNHALLLEGIALAGKAGTVWNWVFAGDGPLCGELKEQARRLGIERQVRWLGRQGRAEVYRLLRICDLSALTSRYENFSIAALESWAHRRPVIGTSVGYLQHLVRESGGGETVAPGDARELAEALARMTNPEMRAEYGRRGRAFVERLDWPRIAERLENLYQKTIK